MSEKLKKRADGRYVATVTLGRNDSGKYIRKYVYATTQAELKKKMKEAENQFEQGVDIIGKRPTLKNWANKWLEVYKPDLHRSQRSVYQGMINKWLAPLHDISMDKIRQIDLQGILLRASKTLSQSSVDKLYNCMRGVFSSARQNGVIGVDISEHLTKPTGGTKSKREALNEHEKEVLKESCKVRPEGALPMIIMYAGLRIGEALALTWGDVKDGQITVDKTIVYEENSNKPTVKNSPKTQAGFRRVPLLKELQPYLDALCGGIDALGSVPLFTSNGKLYSKIMKHDLWETLMADFRAEWKKQWDEAHENAGEEMAEVMPEPRKITSHMLRHTCITLWYDAGIDIKTAQKWAGHATVGVLMDIYTHLSEKKEQEAIDKLQIYVSGQKQNSQEAEIITG